MIVRPAVATDIEAIEAPTDLRDMVWLPALLGFVNAEGVGSGGLEMSLDSRLKGVDGSRTFEQGADTVEKVLAAKSLDRAFEIQQGYAKEAYEAFVAQAAKLNELYVATAKEAYKPYEASLASFGIKAPK